MLWSLAERGWAELTDETLRLTEVGMEWSDTIGPLLCSKQVQVLAAEYDLR